MISDLGFSETEVWKLIKDSSEIPEAFGSNVSIWRGSGPPTPGNDLATIDSPPKMPEERIPTEARPIIEVWKKCFWNFPLLCIKTSTVEFLSFSMPATKFLVFLEL